MSLEPSSVLIFDNQEFQTAINGNQHAFTSTTRHTWMKTNTTGNQILQKCDGIRTLQTISREIAETHEIPEDMVMEHAQAFCRRAIETGLLRHPHDPPCHKPEPALRHLQIQISDFCQLNCTYCPRQMHKDPAEAKFVSPADVESWLSGLKARIDPKTTMITLSGGMVEKHPQIQELLKAIHTRCENLSIILSGGCHPDPTFLEHLHRYCSYAMIRFDSHVQELNDMVRGPGTHASALAMAKACIEKGIETFFLVTPTQETLSSMEEIVEFANRMGSGGVMLSQPISPCEDGTPNPAGKNLDLALFLKKEALMARKVQMLNSWRNGALRNAGNIGKSFYLIRPIYACMNNLSYIIPKSNCGAGTSKLMIDLEGNLYGCAAMQVKNLSIGQASCGIDNTRIPRPPKQCMDCFFQVFCGGGCRAESLFASGDPNGSSLRCEDIQRTFSDWLWDLAIATPQQSQQE